MDSNQQLVTVIIPAYNVSRYLPQCLKSVTRQSYRNLEILVVDDGSTDATGGIADECAECDGRVRVIHKSNGGLSDARNAALDVSQGQWVTFVDGDDLLSADFVRRLLDVAGSTGCDAVVGGHMEFANGNAPQLPESHQAGRVKALSGMEALRAMLYQRKLTHSAWGRIFKRDLFNGLRFPKGVYYEDLAIAHKLYPSIRMLAMTSEPLYYYRQRPGSILATFSMKRTCVLDVMDSVAMQVEQRYPALCKAVHSRQLSANLNMLRLMPIGDPEYAEVSERCWNNVKRLRKECLLDRHTRIRNKAASLISYLGKNALVASINER